MVGHSGKNGCRLYCGLPGRRKECAHCYYPALLCPHDQIPEGSNHADIDVFSLPPGGSSDYSQNLHKIVSVSNQTQWDKMRTETGLTKPPLILGLNPSRSLGIPLCITTDIMHLARNISDLLISLWHGDMDIGPDNDKSTWDWAILRDKDIWMSHGKDVAATGSFLPGSYDRKPWGITKKINTQCKTWEFQLYTFGIALILLYSILPLKYWSHYCQLICGFQILCQYSLTHEQLEDAHTLLCVWERNFELYYYQLHHDHIHFVRPAVHHIIHLIPKAFQKGPPICYTQWTMERTIGNLGQQIRQPSKPYANLAREGVHRSQINALLSIIPELDSPPKALPVAPLTSAMAMCSFVNGPSIPSPLTMHSLNFYSTIYLSLKTFLAVINRHDCSFQTDKLLVPPGGRYSNQRTIYKFPTMLRYVSISYQSH